jgi:hypothetical protein
MKLYEIISKLKEDTNSVLIESMLPYKNSLHTYYSNLFCCEPILMVTMISNAVQYAQIVPSHEFSEAVSRWVESMNLSDEDRDNEIELINLQSIYLNEL